MPFGCSERTWLPAVGILAALGLAGCDKNSGGPTTPPEIHASGLEECGAHNVFHRANFPNSTNIDSKWFPLVPGTQMIFDGIVDLVPHRVVMTVTNLTKTIAGVRTVVVWDRDYSNGQLLESELAFLAQDRYGNVWTIGEYPEEYQEGEFIGAPSTWMAGQELAEAGILVPSSMEVGARFLQGFAPYVNFLDCAVVSKTGQSTCVPFNCFENLLVVDESSPAEGSGLQRKYYASGVGVVRIEPVNDPEGETLVLINVLKLNPQALTDANEAALKLEQRAYQVSAPYRRTAPIR